MFDFFPRFIDNAMTHKTNFGAIVSILMVIVCSVLCGSEIYNFMNPPIKEELIPISEIQNQVPDLTISFNFTVSTPCALTHLDSFTKIGKVVDPYLKSVFKLRLDSNGNPIVPPPTDKCGSCYGAEIKDRKCCYTCEDIINAYQAHHMSIRNMNEWEQCKNEGINLTGGEKCQLFGTLNLYAIDGAFHIAPGINTEHEQYKHDYSPLYDTLNLSHQINTLQFGTPFKQTPLEGKQVIQSKYGRIHYRYDLKVVPTIIMNEEEITRGYQYTVNYAELPVTDDNPQLGPGIFFVYNFAPLAVVRKPDRFSTIILLARLVSISGGAYFLAKLIDSLTFRLNTAEAKKLIGKYF